jgi:hypothetical protein
LRTGVERIVRARVPAVSAVVAVGDSTHA